jgi:hypothetical protein
MMRIQITDLDGQLILQVEGRLAGAFVPELKNAGRLLVRTGRIGRSQLT